MNNVLTPEQSARLKVILGPADDVSRLTLPEQIHLAHGKLLELDADLSKARAENADIKAKEQSIEKRADARAVELMAAVGAKPVSAERHSQQESPKGFARIKAAVARQFPGHPNL